MTVDDVFEEARLMYQQRHGVDVQVPASTPSLCLVGTHADNHTTSHHCQQTSIGIRLFGASSSDIIDATMPLATLQHVRCYT